MTAVAIALGWMLAGLAAILTRLVRVKCQEAPPIEDGYIAAIAAGPVVLFHEVLSFLSDW